MTSRQFILFGVLVWTLGVSLILRDESLRLGASLRRPLSAPPIEHDLGSSAGPTIATGTIFQSCCLIHRSWDIDTATLPTATTETVPLSCDPIPGRLYSCVEEAPRFTQLDKDKSFAAEILRGQSVIDKDFTRPDLLVTQTNALIVMLYCKATPDADWAPCEDASGLALNPDENGNLTKVFMGELLNVGTRFLIAPVPAAK